MLKRRDVRRSAGGDDRWWGRSLVGTGMESAAATVLQSAWRGYATRAAIDSELLKLGVDDVASTNIQAAWRGRVARDEMLLQRLAATDIQAHWRGKLHRDDILLQHLAAVDIQSRYRGYATRQSASATALTVTGPTGQVVRLVRRGDTLELGRGVLGLPLDNSRLHRKHVRISWARQQRGGTWAVQKIGTNPAYIKRSAAEGGEVPKVPSSPDQLAIRDGDTIYCSRPTASLAVTVSFQTAAYDARHTHRSSSEATTKGSDKTQRLKSEKKSALKAKPKLTMPDKVSRARLFRALDVKGTGTLSMVEIDDAVKAGQIGRALHCPGFNHRPTLTRAIKAANYSGDKLIRKREFFTLLKYIVYFNNRWHKFEEITSDENSRLNAEEFANGCEVVGLMLSPEEAAAEFQKCDADGHGRILFGRFCTWCAERDAGDQESDDEDEEGPKLVFSVKQQHRLDISKTVDLKIEPDRVTLLAGTREFDTILYRDVNSWSTRDGRFVDFVLTGDQHRRYATAETVAIAQLLSSAAAAGLLPNAVATSYRAKSPARSAPRTPQRSQTTVHGETTGDIEASKLVFSVKQQHRHDQPKTVDLRVEPDRLRIFAGSKALEDILYSDIKSWSTRTGRSIDIMTTSGQRRRFTTAETTPIGRLLSNSAAKGRLPSRTTAVRVAEASPNPRARTPRQDVRRARTPRQDDRRARTPRQDDRPRRRVGTPQKHTIGRRFPVTQQHLWRASRNAELVVDDRALRLVSGGHTREVYAMASLLSWTILRGKSRSELLLDHSRFVSRNALSFGCSNEVGSALATLLAKLAPTRQLPSVTADTHIAHRSSNMVVHASSSPFDRSVRAAGAGSKLGKVQPRIAVEAVFAVEQLMVKFWTEAPKRLLMGVGSAGLVAFTGGVSSTVVETFRFEEIFSWTTRPSRDITVLLRSGYNSQMHGDYIPTPTSDSNTTVRRLTLRCDESEKLSELMTRLSRGAEITEDDILVDHEGGPAATSTTGGRRTTGTMSRSGGYNAAPGSPATRRLPRSSSSSSSQGIPPSVSLSLVAASPDPAETSTLTSLAVRLAKLKELRAMAQRDER